MRLLKRMVLPLIVAGLMAGMAAPALASPSIAQVHSPSPGTTGCWSGSNNHGVHATVYAWYDKKTDTVIDISTRSGKNATRFVLVPVIENGNTIGNQMKQCGTHRCLTYFRVKGGPVVPRTRDKIVRRPCAPLGPKAIAKVSQQWEFQVVNGNGSWVLSYWQLCIHAAKAGHKVYPDACPSIPRGAFKWIWHRHQGASGAAAAVLTASVVKAAPKTPAMNECVLDLMNFRRGKHGTAGADDVFGHFQFACTTYPTWADIWVQIQYWNPIGGHRHKGSWDRAFRALPLGHYHPPVPATHLFFNKHGHNFPALGTVRNYHNAAVCESGQRMRYLASIRAHWPDGSVDKFSRALPSKDGSIYCHLRQ